MRPRCGRAPSSWKKFGVTSPPIARCGSPRPRTLKVQSPNSMNWSMVRACAAVVGDFDEGEARVLDARRDLRLAQVHDAVGLGVGQRPQQHAVDDAEDGGVGADAEAERQDEGEREPRHAGQRAQREADVVDHGTPRSWMISRLLQAASVPDAKTP